MNGINNGIIIIRAQTTNTTYQYIEFSEYVTSFSNNKYPTTDPTKDPTNRSNK